jgi:hypothetical protein
MRVHPGSDTPLLSIHERIKNREKYPCEKCLYIISKCAIAALFCFSGFVSVYGIKEKDTGLIANGCFGAIVSPMFYCIFRAGIKRHYDNVFSREESRFSHV